MAEILVLNHDSWMDKLTDKQLNEYLSKYPKFASKYNSRPQKGDVVDVKEDGHWTGPGRGYDKNHYDVVIVKGKKVEEVLHMRKPLCTYTAEKFPVLLKKFKYNISSYTDKQEVTLADFTEKAI